MLKSNSSGIILSLTLGIAAMVLSGFTPSWLNSILISLLVGIAINNLIRIPDRFQPGITFTSSKLLELSVVFLAFNINFKTFADLGLNSFLTVVLMVFIMLILTYYLAKKVKCPESSGWLIGFGTAICGSSAIAALSPMVAKNKENVGISMAVVNLLGTVGMITLPFVLGLFLDNNQEIGMMLGGTLHSVGNVAGSAFAVNNEVGEAAITIKLARVALLSPGLIFFHYLLNKKGSLDSEGKQSVSLPWYLWSFIAITVLGSFVTFPEKWIEITEQIGKVVLTIAMASIGLKIGFKKLIQTGQKGFIFGLLIFVFQFFLVWALMKVL